MKHVRKCDHVQPLVRNLIATVNFMIVEYIIGVFYVEDVTGQDVRWDSLQWRHSTADFENLFADEFGK